LTRREGNAAHEQGDVKRGLKMFAKKTKVTKRLKQAASNSIKGRKTHKKKSSGTEGPWEKG